MARHSVVWVRRVRLFFYTFANLGEVFLLIYLFIFKTENYTGEQSKAFHSPLIGIIMTLSVINDFNVAAMMKMV